MAISQLYFAASRVGWFNSLKFYVPNDLQNILINNERVEIKNIVY